MYKQVTDTIVQRVEDGAFIPLAPGNMDYEAFRQWQARGGKLEPADPIPETPPEPTKAELLAAAENLLAAASTLPDEVTK